MQALVYADEGVNSSFLHATLYTLKEHFSRVIPITYQQLMDEKWEKTTHLFVMPGGRDLPYDRKLRVEGTTRIRKFVENGGSFLGICAGAYFASSRVIFERNTPLEVYETRRLKLFPGSTIGTLYTPHTFAYHSEKGAHASKISYKEGSLHLYYNGGCTFYLAESFPSVTLLAKYQDLNEQPAIIHCKVGQGNVLLSGVHFELDMCKFGHQWSEMGQCKIRKLQNSDKKRKQMILYLLQWICEEIEQPPPVLGK